MKMLRSPILAFLVYSLTLALTAQAAPLSGTETSTTTTATITKNARPTKTPSSVTIISTGSSLSSSASATPSTTNDDTGEYIPPPPETEQYYENQGAGGDSTGFINLSIGAQAGIIIAIVLAGLVIMGGCIWFWKKKQKEWKAATERRRTMRASRAKPSRGNRTPLANMSVAPGKKLDSKKAESPPTNNKSQSSENIVSTELTVPISQFDVMTPTEEEKPSWWKKVLVKQK